MRVKRRGESKGEESLRERESTEDDIYRRGESAGEERLQERRLYRRGESAGERVYRR